MHEIRAQYDANTITVYQAYGPSIAQPSLKANRFVEPFLRTRMTWVKPSFLWMMERSNWAQKAGQEYVLAVRMRRSGWDEALASSVLTSPDGAPSTWRERFDNSAVHVQWDPERSLRGTKLAYRTIQVGLSRRIIDRYADEWVVDLIDMTPTVKRIQALCRQGDWARAESLLPRERRYDVPPHVAGRLMMV